MPMINKGLKWAECPGCKTTINGWQFYPASMVKGASMDDDMKCPKCGLALCVTMEVTTVIKAIPFEESYY
jgi:hypothetical protein